MELHFQCRGFPDSTALHQRLNRIRGLGSVQSAPDGREITIQSVDAKTAHEVLVCMQEAGWRMI